MKAFVFTLAALVALSFATTSDAQPPNRPGARQKDGEERRGPGQRARGPQGAGEGGPRGAGGPGGPGFGDPAKMAAMMLEKFDKDGDQKLNVAELEALLTQMRQRRMNGEGGPRGPRGAGDAGGRPMPGEGKGGPGAGRRPGGPRGPQTDKGEGAGGGVKPRRPAAEE